jgi:hypothetical protein
MSESQQKGQRHRLRENLIEHFDFEAVYPIVWKHLYSWYSADIQIARLLRKDAVNRNIIRLDLYPIDDQTTRQSELIPSADYDSC